MDNLKSLLNRRTFLGSVAASAAGLCLKANPVLAALAAGPKVETEMLLSFGSCNFQWDLQVHWSVIGSLSPDLWIWLGDNMYSDGLTPELRQLSYELVKYNPNYFLFRQQVPIIGTWDDHDYGLNNSGRELPFKEESQTMALDFLDVSETDPLRSQEGIYHSNVFEKGGHWIKVILLDLRYFRDIGTPDGELLGDAQWQWLERELLELGKTELVLIGSSSQCVSTVDDGDGWDMYPTERARLYQLLAKSKAPVVILSGDTHWSAISRVPFVGAASGQKWLYDFTSSGLTHFDPANGQSDLVSPILSAKNFGTIRIRFHASSALPEVTFEMRRITGGVFFSLPVQLN